MTTNEAFREWFDNQDKPKRWWENPKVVANMFIDWGDYVKDKYAIHSAQERYKRATIFISSETYMNGFSKHGTDMALRIASGLTKKK